MLSQANSTIQHWIGLSSVLRPRQHSIGYMGDGFYRLTHVFYYTLRLFDCICFQVRLGQGRNSIGLINKRLNIRR